MYNDRNMNTNTMAWRTKNRNRNPLLSMWPGNQELLRLREKDFLVKKRNYSKNI